MIGLEMNTGKTKWMRNSFCTEGIVCLDDVESELVKDYVYLGRQMESNNCPDGEWDRRRAGWIAFGRYKSVLTDRTLPMKLRASISKTTVLPAMLYACETWATAKVVEEKLAITERTMERQMCGVTRNDRIKNDDLRRMTGVKDVVTEMYRSKRCWAGHVARMSDNRWIYRLTKWIPRETKGPLGRPKTRWDEPLVKLFGQCWERIAQSRHVRNSVDLRSHRERRRSQGDRKSHLVQLMGEKVMVVLG
ncbi:unnamed protein product [Toxocara canis]|uniref:Endonuclease-reverse transcriptase n=1 Tax=Toxocara canis TaxID=6265 RepID=A0A183U5K7_TOXCA|nr:unnamed protein product [Toxocara canis]